MEWFVINYEGSDFKNMEPREKHQRLFDELRMLTFHDGWVMYRGAFPFTLCTVDAMTFVKWKRKLKLSAFSEMRFVGIEIYKYWEISLNLLRCLCSDMPTFTAWSGYILYRLCAPVVEVDHRVMKHNQAWFLSRLLPFAERVVALWLPKWHLDSVLIVRQPMASQIGEGGGATGCDLCLETVSHSVVSSFYDYFILCFYSHKIKIFREGWRINVEVGDHTTGRCHPVNVHWVTALSKLWCRFVFILFCTTQMFSIQSQFFFLLYLSLS